MVSVKLYLDVPSGIGDLAGQSGRGSGGGRNLIQHALPIINGRNSETGQRTGTNANVGLFNP